MYNALITGGTHGIGEAIAKQLALDGFHVIIVGRNRERAEKVIQDIEQDKGSGEFLLYDLSRDENIINVCNNLPEIVSVLVNNVGGGGRKGMTFLTTRHGVWGDVWDINFGVAQKLIFELVPGMVKEKFGRVITISSIAGLEATGKSWFTLAKSAEIMFMKSLSKDKELSRAGVTFNSVAPGAIMIPDTGWDRMQKEQPEEFQKFCESLPTGKLGTSQDVANVVSFLCSRKASFINGTCIKVDGGESNGI